MSKELLVPELSKEITYHKFSCDSYFIHQKHYNHRIKITRELYSLLQRIDGRKNMLELAQEDGCDIDSLYTVLYMNLAKYGIVKSPDIKVSHKKKPNYLKLSFIVIPPKLISKVTPYLKFLFQPKVMLTLFIFSLTVIVFGIINKYDAIVSLNMDSIWLPLLIFGFISVTFHEFGHVTATDYFGAEHGGIGGGFYLFTPVYFADVTDIWKLKSGERIIVNLAGIYFELLICSLYVVVGILFSSNLLYLIGLLIFVKTLFNLNPFLRSDGYWVLTDAVGIPNLYKTSSLKLWGILKKIFTGKGNAITAKNFMLALYASVNYLILVVFLYYVIVLNPNSILHFPVNITNFIQGLFNGSQELSLQNISQFAIPLFFYYLLFQIVISYISKYMKKSKVKVD